MPMIAYHSALTMYRMYVNGGSWDISESDSLYELSVQVEWYVYTSEPIQIDFWQPF